MQNTKTRVDAALDQLAEALDEGHSESLKNYLAAMGRFHRYSLGNSLLIALARPNATHVAGFHTWKKLGRKVKRGEKGIAILAPIVRRKVSDDEIEDEDRCVIAFRGAHVFDIAQTEGRPLPEFAQARGDPAAHLDRLRHFVDRRGITLSYSAELRSAMGISAGGQIVLQARMTAAEEFSTLVHELAHEMVHRAEGRPGSRVVRETEAEAVAFVVCQAIGLDSNTAASDYIQLYQGDRKLLMASLERIRSTALEIIEAIREEELSRAA